jgi:hypothetical protein
MAYSANYKDIAEIRLVSSIGELASEFLNILTDLGISDNDSRKAVNIALSGGSTPLKMYEKLRLLQHELVTREKLNFSGEMNVVFRQTTWKVIMEMLIRLYFSI